MLGFLSRLIPACIPFRQRFSCILLQFVIPYGHCGASPVPVWWAAMRNGASKRPPGPDAGVRAAYAYDVGRAAVRGRSRTASPAAEPQCGASLAGAARCAKCRLGVAADCKGVCRPRASRHVSGLDACSQSGMPPLSFIFGIGNFAYKEGGQFGVATGLRWDAASWPRGKLSGFHISEKHKTLHMGNVEMQSERPVSAVNFHLLLACNMACTHCFAANLSGKTPPDQRRRQGGPDDIQGRV